MEITVLTENDLRQCIRMDELTMQYPKDSARPLEEM